MEKEELYSMSKISEFRKSIAKMGTTVPNGNVSFEPVKNRRQPQLRPEDVLRTPYNDKEAWRIYSRIFYSNPLYRRAIDYLATLLYNHYMITPVIGDKKPNKKKLMNDYNAALRSLDEDMTVEEFTSKCLLDLLIEGETFYYLEEYKKGASIYYKPIKLPADYCKIIGTAGTPAVNIFAVDLTFIDTVMTELISKNILTREEILKQYPKALRKAYEEFKTGSHMQTNNKKWFVVPIENGICFSTPDGRPPFAFLTKTIVRMEKLEPLKDDYISTNLTKLLVQIIDIDKEGNPEVDLEMAAEFHKNLRDIAASKHNVDALTTLAKEVDVLSLGETGDATKNYEFLTTYYDQFYKNSGISAELFNAQTSGTLEYSEAKDESFMYHLRKQIENWFNYYLNTICNKKVIKNTKFVFSYLETSYKNREKMIDSYLKGAQYGFSKLAPQIAMGVKQRYIESLVYFENEVLDLDAKLVPLQSSHTMSGKGNSNSNPTADSATNKDSDVVTKDNGRPTVESDEKEDSTIAKDASK